MNGGESRTRSTVGYITDPNGRIDEQIDLLIPRRSDKLFFDLESFLLVILECLDRLFDIFVRRHCLDETFEHVHN